jgi:excisionase family DNA binding protein
LFSCFLLENRALQTGHIFLLDSHNSFVSFVAIVSPVEYNSLAIYLTARERTMTTITHKHQEPTTPNDREIGLARETGPRLATFVEEGQAVEVRVGNNESLMLPPLSARLLAEILTYMGEGKAVAVLPADAELTSQQAAEVLNVSRPYLVKLLDEGKLPHRKVGTRRRVLLCDVLAYKKQVADARAKVLDELAAQAQELNMGY